MQNLEQALAQEGAWLAGSYDIAVIGAGHAGCEAALASARLGKKTLLLAMDLDTVANMPCNPNIGGTGKGQLVREIDALGGEMGRLADQAMIQFRMLNASKGPAVLSPRAQIDRRHYQQLMKQVLERQSLLHLRQAEVVGILVETGQDRSSASGILLKTGAVYQADAVVVATGTFLDSEIIIGQIKFAGASDNHFAAHGLSGCLRNLGLPVQRFKTGTPPRLNGNSLDYSKLEKQDGDGYITPFSHASEPFQAAGRIEQQPCYLTHTTATTRRLVEDNLDRSPLYSGKIAGTGTRYCPSIEDKYVKFPDKQTHQVFIEPMGRDTDEVYLQGLSSSMPEDIQQEMVHSLPGLDQAQIMRFGYAIEYDCLDPVCLKASLETRQVAGLYAAGQINGTSGYEEAAAQGLVAGINAVRQLDGLPAVLIDRSKAYIGVMIDDLVTKGTNEPYRMMTSRAEYRLLLRQDNADSRLTPLGYQVGLIDEQRWQDFQIKQGRIEKEIERWRKTRLYPGASTDDLLSSLGSARLRQPVSLADLIRRPELSYAALAPLDPQRPVLTPAEQYSVEVLLKYEGYIRLEEERIRKFQKLEQKQLPTDLDYSNIRGLRLEARQKLAGQKPQSLGQASRMAGVTPADISVLLVFLQMQEDRARAAGSVEVRADG